MINLIHYAIVTNFTYVSVDDRASLDYVTGNGLSNLRDVCFSKQDHVAVLTNMVIAVESSVALDAQQQMVFLTFQPCHLAALNVICIFLTIFSFVLQIFGLPVCF